MDQPLKIIDFLKGVLQCFSFPATLISTLFVPAKPTISTTYRHCVMLLVSVMGIKPKQEGASFDIVVVVDPLSKGNNATPFFSCANFFTVLVSLVSG